MKEGVDYAWSKRAIPVLAAGNSNTGGLGPKGSGYGDMNAIIVGATGPDDKPAEYSTSTGGAKWAVAAPGGAGSPTGQGRRHLLHVLEEQREERLHLPGRYLDGRPLRDGAPSPCSWPRATTPRAP